MRHLVYWQKADRLIYLDEQATPDFWDDHWLEQGSPPPADPRDAVVTVTPKYVAAGARIIEGGCGRANKVKAMADAGFAVVGVDFAEETVRRAKAHYPGLDVRTGDVRSLDFPDDTFDGYWSIGVIEHFWEGYDEILKEAARVLKPRGVLFLTAPWFSPYRRWLARSGVFEERGFSNEPEHFYQFALGRQEVVDQLRKHGFEVQAWHGMASEISMKEDTRKFSRQIEWLFATRGSLAKRVFRRVITDGLNPLLGHSFLAVARLARPD